MKETARAGKLSEAVGELTIGLVSVMATCLVTQRRH